MCQKQCFGVKNAGKAGFLQSSAGGRAAIWLKVPYFCINWYILHKNILKILHNAQKLFEKYGLQNPILSDIIDGLDMRRSERLLQGDAFAGNFRGVCPFNRAKGVHRSTQTAQTCAALPYSQLLNPRNLSAWHADWQANSVSFGKGKKLTEQCCREMPALQPHPADGYEPSIICVTQASEI